MRSRLDTRGRLRDSQEVEAKKELFFNFQKICPIIH
jgi:hypothetical protein